MVFINTAAIFSLLMHASLVTSLPRPDEYTSTTTTINLETENVGVIDLQRRFQRVLDAAAQDDTMRLYALVSGLTKYNIQMTNSDGTAVTLTGGNDSLAIMNDFMTQVVFHTYDPDWVALHAKQAMELIQETGYRYTIDTTVTYESTTITQTSK